MSRVIWEKASARDFASTTEGQITPSARPSKKRTVDGILKQQTRKLTGLDIDHHTAKTTSESVQALFQQVFPVTFPSRERIDWLPVDKASHVLVDILISSSRAAPKGDESGTLVYHVVNPNAASWSTPAPDILKLYPERQGLRAVQYDEWVEALSGEGFDDPERNPAVKLLDFYRQAAKASKRGPRMLPSHKAEAASRTLRRVRPVQQDWVKVWMQQ
ncbi:MAG: hypothetical protein L6R42_006757 [Xanthoria sp. 1 TBL-2021]|nr:MAG: hypothetical protein L6R42_006757 [Xanthoria sp. 1 TBL-2021]